MASRFPDHVEEKRSSEGSDGPGPAEEVPASRPVKPSTGDCGPVPPEKRSSQSREGPGRVQENEKSSPDAPLIVRHGRVLPVREGEEIPFRTCWNADWNYIKWRGIEDRVCIDHWLGRCYMTRAFCPLVHYRVNDDLVGLPVSYDPVPENPPMQLRNPPNAFEEDIINDIIAEMLDAVELL
ncbi:uncharacterized protein LOC135818986 [Sycon ciliatum]|uniref:uncharacterized protein LOC135818986 n=1 Tax=Sycon ciliatum TaxID=27933 RepID=UPI0031F67890